MHDKYFSLFLSPEKGRRSSRESREQPFPVKTHPLSLIFPLYVGTILQDTFFFFARRFQRKQEDKKLLFLPRKIPSSDPKTQSPIVSKGRKKRGSPIDTRFFLENTDIPGELLSSSPSLFLISPSFPKRGPCGQKAAAKKSSSLPPPSPKPPWGQERRKKEKPRRPS